MSNAFLLIVPEDPKKNEKINSANESWTDAAVRYAKEAAPVALGFNPGLGILGLAGYGIYKYFERPTNQDSKFLKLTKSEAAIYSFPPGHAQEGVLYAQHPAQENRYYPCASFHRLVFEHKFSEAVRFLMALGATRIKVEQVTGLQRDISANFKAEAEVLNTSADFNSKNSQANSLKFEAKYEGHSNPSLPDDLVWFEHEPTWRTAAEGRLQYRMKSFNLDLNYTEDYGVNAALAAEAGKHKISLGGNFEQHSSTVWRLEGEFL